MSKMYKVFGNRTHSCISFTVNINELYVLILQNFYQWKKDKRALKEINDKDKAILIKVNKLICTQTISI